MAFTRHLRKHRLLFTTNLQNPKPLCPTHSLSSNSYPSDPSFSSIFHRPISISAQINPKISLESVDISDSSDSRCIKSRKPLSIFFKQAVGVSQNPETTESESEGEGGEVELKKKLRKFEEELRSLKEKSHDREVTYKPEGKESGMIPESDSKPSSLYALFSNRDESSGHNPEESRTLATEDPDVYKELSPDMVTFVTHLYKQGYFKDSNFLPRNRFDISCFENSYARAYVKYAAEEFGKDNQEIAKWLSGSDLKKVAFFGCPSLGRKAVFSAKRLRNFFKIQEDVVCGKCPLRDSCKFVNQSVWKGDTNTLNLAVVMRVIILYALESVPPQLQVTEEIKDCVSRLLKDVLRLSQTIS